MLKLNASFSKKVPAEQEYSSKGYSATIEIELPDGLTQEQLQGRIHDTFKLVKSSVENEINGTATVNQVQAPTPVNSNTKPYQNSNSNNRNYSQNKKTNEFASPKQIKYLCDLARTGNIQLNGYLENYGHAQPSELTKQECSYLINMIKDQQVA
jgi:hypothetical protein